MQTTHEVRVGDARELDVEPESVDLVVTSPPYPMVEMWDECFASQDDSIADAIDAGDGQAAFEAMHALLDDVWRRVAEALSAGGIAAVNVGDATRRIDGQFRLYPNHARIVRGMGDAGLTQLPGIVWRKPTNSAAKFMGSGTLPTNAYATLEHEHVLLFRKGGTRSFPPKDDDRYASAFFWDERNTWFSDHWEITGTRQALDDAGGDTGDGTAESTGDSSGGSAGGMATGDGSRERSGAFPLEIPLRLVRMYSIRGDTVLDPFVGTGTTSLAALLEARSSIGVERDPDLAAAFERRAEAAQELSALVAEERLQAQKAFADEHAEKTNYEAEHYDTRVVTADEREIRLSTVADVERAGDDSSRYVASHEPL